nr:MAG TPA: hypothetical protein [Caudoviricetes sp.]
MAALGAALTSASVPGGTLNQGVILPLDRL